MHTNEKSSILNKVSNCNCQNCTTYISSGSGCGGCNDSARLDWILLKKGKSTFIPRGT